ncbi:MAG: hypothetical protein SGILL_001540 [Bacillariaceae sp.]
MTRSARSLIGSLVSLDQKIEVAVEGISLGVSRGGAGNSSIAVNCLEEIGALTLPQLRWIFSSFTDEQLIEDGWDPKSVPFLDKNPNTRLWSELSPACAAVEIVIAGPPVDSISAQLFRELVFGQKKAENFDVSRAGSAFASDENDVLAEFLSDNKFASIAYFDIGYVLSSINLADIVLVDLEVEEEIFKANAKALEGGTYPLSRILHYFLHDDEDSLHLTRGFVDFIFSQEGDEVTKRLGYWPLSEAKKLIMETRIQSILGIPKSLIKSYCGPPSQSISMAGSSTVLPVADLWSRIYSEFCDVSITVEGGGSSNGAGRVCGNEARGTPVDIGSMSREWRDTEGSEEGGYIYECLKGDTTRSAIQVDVAIDGLTVAVGFDGAAKECVDILGGLSTDQLRWMYSNYDENELEATGWDPTSVPNSDGSSQTHKWSELDAACSTSEIRIAGPDLASGTYAFFAETIFADHENGETFDLFRPGFSYFNSEDDDLLVDYVFTYPQAIAFFGYNYYFENRERLAPVSVLNSDGQFVRPTQETIGDGSYNPLARRIYMNLLNSEALENTVPLIRFGLENPRMVSVTGYVAILEDQASDMIATRLTLPSSGQGESDNLSGGAIAGIVVGVVTALLVIALAVMNFRKKGDKKEVAPDMSAKF